MKALNSIILIFLTVQLFGQGIAHYQIKEPQAEKGDSFLTFIRDGDYYRFGTATIDTSDINFLNEYFNIRADVGWEKVKDTLAFYLIENNLTAYKLTDFDSAGFRVNISQVDGYVDPDLSDYATLVDVGDTANVIRSQIPDYETDPVFTAWDKSKGISITESQISDLQDYLTNSDLSGLRDSTLSNTGKDTTGIYHANRALLDAIDVNDTTRWGEQPEFLTDLDSTNFDIDTTQVRNLKTFVENNSGEVSISGTANYIPKFGVSGLTESSIYEDGSGNVGIGTTTPSAKLEVNGRISTASSRGNLVFDGNLTSGVSTIQFNSPSETTSQIWINPMTPNGTESSLFRLFRNINTTGTAAIEILAANATSSVQTQLAANRNSYLNAITGNVGIGTTAPSAKLEVNGNIKADTIKAVLDTIYADKTSWSEFVGGGGSAVTSVTAADGLIVSPTTGDVVVYPAFYNFAVDNTINGSDYMFWNDVNSGFTRKITPSNIASFLATNYIGLSTLADVPSAGANKILRRNATDTAYEWIDTPTGGTTNLSTSYTSTGVSINSDTGTDATINNATTTVGGILSSADKVNLDAAYNDRLKWDGGSTGLNATTGRSSLGLGSMATKNFWSGTQTQYDNLSSYDSNTIYFIED